MQPALELESVVTYRDICKIASGGMGEVRLAMRRGGSFVRLYAIKRLHPHLREDADVRAGFLEEARIAGMLRHPNIVSVVDVGEDSDGPFLVMEYVEGVPLSTIVQRSKTLGEPVPLGVALRIMLQAAQGLAAAHELTSPDGASLQLVHRDVSPQNVLVGFDGNAHVADFGIARALGRQTRTATGLVKGKLGYLAPEQLLYRPCDRRTDLFALGIVLFELIAGRRLYGGKDLEDSARRILEEPPPDLGDEREDVPPELVGLVFKLLAKSPEHRPADARVVARTLETLLAELTSAGEPTDVAEHLARLFGDERAKRQQTIADAIDGAATQTSLVSGPHLALHLAETSQLSIPAKRVRSPLIFAGIGAAALFLIGIAASAGAWAMFRDREVAPTMAATPSSIEVRPPPAAPVAAEPSLPLPPAARVDPPPAPPASGGEDEAEEVVAPLASDPPPAPPASGRGDQRRRPPRRGGGNDSLWGWRQ